MRNAQLNLDSLWGQVGFHAQIKAKLFGIMGAIYMERELL